VKLEEVVPKGMGRSGSRELAQVDWCITQKPEETSPLPAVLLGLDRGEIDVILLARELEAGCDGLRDRWDLNRLASVYRSDSKTGICIMNEIAT
jgi:hypothetical protein